MKVGYARGAPGHALAEQLVQLDQAGCAPTYSDSSDAALDERPGLEEAIAATKAGDHLVVPSLDRLARTYGELVRLAACLKRRGVHLQSLAERLDTAAKSGSQFYRLCADLERFEHILLLERTVSGLVNARAEGNRGGKTQLDERTIALIHTYALDPTVKISEACAALGISRATFYRYGNQVSLPVRRPGRIGEDLIKKIQDLSRDNGINIAEVSRSLGISRSTFKRYAKRTD